MAEQDKIKVANEALRRFGAGTILSFEEETQKAATVAAIYATVVDDAFQATRWTFARRTARLDLLPDAPLSGYARAFALPGDRVGDPVKVIANPSLPDHPLRIFALEGDELHANVTAVWATCVRRVDPNYWPPMFRRAVVTALAAELVVPISHDTKLADNLRAQTWGTPSEGGRGGLMGRAMAIDVASSPGSAAPIGAVDPLTDAWHGE